MSYKLQKNALPAFNHFLGGLGILEELPTRIRCVLRLDELRRDVVHDFFVHTPGHFVKALTGQHGVESFIDGFPFKQPSVERSSGSGDACKQSAFI